MHRFAGRHTLRLVLVAGLTAWLGGCAAYQIGNRSLYRPDIRTIYVPIVQSDSYRRYLGERLTEALVKQIELDTPYKVVHYPEADSTLIGRISWAGKRALIEDPFDEPRNLEVLLNVEVTWVNRQGESLMQPTYIPLPLLATTFSQTANFVPEGGQSLETSYQETSQRLAKQIVTQMQIPW